MGLLTVIPGDDAVHTPTQTRVHILSYADGNFTAVATDEANNLVNTRRVVGPVTDFAATTPRPSLTPRPEGEGQGVRDEIARLQTQVADLHKKLQAAEIARDEAASRAAELLAQPEPVATPKTAIEVMVLRDASQQRLSEVLTAGWGILHMQFMSERDEYDDGSTRGARSVLNVVLQRTVTTPAPQPEQRAAVRTVTGTVVPLPHVGDDDEYDDDEPDDVPPLPALDPDPLMPASPPLHAMGRGQGGGDFTRAVLSARLPPAQTLELLNNRLKETARAAYNAAPAPLPYMPLGVSK